MRMFIREFPDTMVGSAASTPGYVCKLPPLPDDEAWVVDLIQVDTGCDVAVLNRVLWVQWAKGVPGETHTMGAVQRVALDEANIQFARIGTNVASVAPVGQLIVGVPEHHIPGEATVTMRFASAQGSDQMVNCKMRFRQTKL